MGAVSHSGPPSGPAHGSVISCSGTAVSASEASVPSRRSVLPVSSSLEEEQAVTCTIKEKITSSFTRSTRMGCTLAICRRPFN
jgi:hypothetical protein